MAQHIDILKNPENKREKEIVASIKANFSKGIMRVAGSLKFERVQGYSESPNDEVFVTERSIPSGWVYNSDRGSFECHYDMKKRKLTKIYLVA